MVGGGAARRNHGRLYNGIVDNESGIAARRGISAIMAFA